MADLPFDATAFLILFARVGAVLMLIPAFSEDAIPGRVRLLLGLGFTAGLFGLLEGRVAPVVRSDTALPGIIIAELLVGIAMGMIIRILFHAAAMAGSIVSLQVGLSSALIFDPALGGQLPLLAKLVSVAAAVMCMALGVHHLWIASIVHSYGVFPVGGLPPAEDFARLAVTVTGNAMSLALSMAAPLIVYGIVFNVALGLAARMAPAIQVFFITQPLNILLGLALFAVVIGAALTGFAEAMAAFMQNGWKLEVMPGGSDQDNKTEEPSQKKLDDARARGEVASAPEMRHASMFVAAIVIAGGLGAWTLASLGTMFVRLWGNANDFALEPQGAQNLMTGIFAEVAMSLAPIAAVLFGFALLTPFLQGRPTFARSRIAPKWSKLSPMAGFKRLLGMRALVEFAKTLAKFTAIAIVALMVIWPKAVAFDQLIGSTPDAIGKAAAELVFQMIKAVAILVALIAGADFVYQRRAFMKRMRMSLQELKDEFKQSDGDPKIKAKIRSIQMQRAKKRMMSAVPGASVIVTNPTHYAVALKYEHGDMTAPVVVAKGVDAVALRIREIATEAKVPIVESPPLARALFAAVEIDHPIPVEHYAAVAEIIGYVMRLARRVA